MDHKLGDIMAIGSTIGSALGGVGGAAAASLIPGVGPFVAPFAGAAGGTLGSYLGGLFDSNGNSNMNNQNQYPQGPYGIQRFSPEVQSQLANLLKESSASFGPIEQQARQQFQSQTLPAIAERFTSLGGSSRRSSSLEGANYQAGAGLEQGLASLKSQHGLQLLQTLLPYLEQTYQPKQPTGFAENFGVGLSELSGLLPFLLMYLTQGNSQSNQTSGSQQVTPNWNTGQAPQNPSVFNKFNLGI
jgi:hypothetical protein